MNCEHTKLYADDVIRGPQRFEPCLFCERDEIGKQLDAAFAENRALRIKIDAAIKALQYIRRVGYPGASWVANCALTGQPYSLDSGMESSK